MVIVHPPRRLSEAISAGVPHVMIEHCHSRRSEPVAQQAFDLRIVNRLYLVGVVEISDLAWRFDESEAVAVQVELRFTSARIFYRNVMGIIDAIPRGHSRRRFHDIARRL